MSDFHSAEFTAHVEELETCGEELTHTCLRHPIDGVCYFLMEVLARGGQAVIFMAYMAGGIKVVLKIFPCCEKVPPKAYTRELETLQTLQTQTGFVPLIDHFVLTDLKYAVLVLPLYAAGTWDKYILKDTTKGFRHKAKWLFRQLQILHENYHLCHGDVKPQNILVHHNGQWALGDFGFAVPLATAEPLRATGTWDFMAPEIHAPERWLPTTTSVAEIRQKRDVWSAGITLWELYAGQPPWAHLDMTPMTEALTSGTLPWHQITVAPIRDFLQFILQPAVAERPFAAQVLTHEFLASHSVRSKGTS